MIKMIIKNISDFATKSKIIFIIFVLVQFFSLVATIFFASFFGSIVEMNEQGANYLRRYTVDKISNEDVFDNLNELCELMNDKIIGLRIINSQNKLGVDFLHCEKFANVTTGEYLSDSNQIVLSELGTSGMILRQNVIGDEIEYLDKKLLLVGIGSSNPESIISYETYINNYSDIDFDYFEIYVNEIPNVRDVEYMKISVYKLFPNAIINISSNASEYSNYAIQYLISISTFLLAIINLSFVYNYVLSKRKKQLLIMRTCGYTSLKCIKILLIEVLSLSTVVYLISALLSHLILPEIFSLLFKGLFLYNMSLLNYTIIYLIFQLIISVIFFVNIKFFVTKSIKKSKEIM